MAAYLLGSNCRLVCSKGDVACSEETDYVLTSANRSRDKVLHGIMHAGAVLDSKIIANIAIRSIRNEYSGE